MISPEPRTWEPSVRIEPLTKSKPTNLDIAKMSNQIHECLEDHREKTAASFVKVERDVSALRDALLGPKTVATSSTFASFMRNVLGSLTAAGALILAYKLWTVIWPPIDAAIRSGRL